MKIELETRPVTEPFIRERHAQIIVSEYTRSEDSMPQLSPDLMTMDELEYYLGKIRKQLDSVERAGRKYFK